MKKALSFIVVAMVAAFLWFKTEKDVDPTSQTPTTIQQAPNPSSDHPDSAVATLPAANAQITQLADDRKDRRTDGAQRDSTLEVAAWYRRKGYFADPDERAFYMSQDLETLSEIAAQGDVLAARAAGDQLRNRDAGDLAIVFYSGGAFLGSTESLVAAAQLYRDGLAGLSDLGNPDNRPILQATSDDPKANELALVLLAEARGDWQLAADYFESRVDMSDYPATSVTAGCRGARQIYQRMTQLRVQTSQPYFDDTPLPGDASQPPAQNARIRSIVCDADLDALAPNATAPENRE
ncbi:MAG: hypothetical protein AAFO81_00595 [Pseudomonadota bacterium]